MGPQGARVADPVGGARRKPDSVSGERLAGDDHLSGMRVTAHLGATSLDSDGPSVSYEISSGLASGGVYPRPRHRGAP